ncbi:Syntaxin UFE1 [Trichinella spiralis]|uniref:Syntaxin UFE1 n=1 Tax=Trichinella spiralis TaxID=6334 RepID=A0ABR3KXJ5_TRISP
MFLKEFQTSLRLLHNSVLSQIYCNHLDRFNRCHVSKWSFTLNCGCLDIGARFQCLFLKGNFLKVQT